MQRMHKSLFFPGTAGWIVLLMSAGVGPGCSSPSAAPAPPAPGAPAAPTRTAPEPRDTPAAPSRTAPEPSDPHREALLRACPAAAGMNAAGAEMCHEMGCSSGFHLSVFPRANWPHGHYRFVITRDERSLTCEGDLPLKPCGESSLVCDAPGVGITESGCGLAPEAHAFGDITFDGFPLRVRVQVFRADQPVADATFTPAYRAHQPNGPGCDPICCQASGNLTLTK